MLAEKKNSFVKRINKDLLHFLFREYLGCGRYLICEAVIQEKLSNFKEIVVMQRRSDTNNHLFCI